MPSDDISRLYDFVAGTTIVADQVDAEFNQIVTTLNGKVGRTTTETISGVKTFSAANSHTGNNTFSGQNIFSDATAPIKTDRVVENTVGGGITVDGCLHRDGNVRLGTIRATVSSIDTGTDVITTDTHGLSTADPVRMRALSGGSLPGGVSATTVYYARAVSATTLTLHPTAADATGNTNILNLTSAGAGTLQIIGDISTPSEGEVWYNNGLKYRHLGNTETLPVAATQADQETPTSTGVYVPPARQQHHPSSVKAWVYFVGTGTVTINKSYNVSSITDNGTGDYTINFTTAFSDANYCGVIGGYNTGSADGSWNSFSSLTSPTASAIRMICFNSSGVAQDQSRVYTAFFGDQ